MVKYNWTIYDIENRLTKLKTLLKKEKNPKKVLLFQIDIQRIEVLLEEYFSKEIYDQEKLLTEYEYRKDDYSQFEFLKTDFAEFNRITDDIIVPPELKTCSLSKKDILDVTHDFYKSLDRYFFGNFMKNFARRNDHIIFTSINEDEIYKGATRTILSLKESFIDIKRDFTLLDVLTTIHEYMHATSALINPYHFLDNKYLYLELDTAFIELVAADYLDYIFNNDSGLAMKVNGHMERASDAFDLTDTFKIINYEKVSKSTFTNNKQLKKAAQVACNLSGEELEDMLFMPDTQPETYVTGYIFAVELYNIYQEDKEKALYLLRKIIELSNNDLEGYYKEIKKLSIYPNQHMLEYHRELARNVNNLKRIKEKCQK